MDYSKYTDFENFTLVPISRHLRRTFDDLYADYNFELSKKHRLAVKEIRDNRIKNESDVEHLEQYNRDLLEKSSKLKDSLFQEKDEGIIYLLDGIKLDDSTNTFMNCIRALRGMVYSIDRIAKINQIPNSNLPKTILPRKSTSSRPRNPDKNSFVLKNPKVNFNAIHARLIAENHPFIDPRTTSEELSHVFLGFNITEKVVWYEANSLRYLIRELIENELIEPPNEGIWRRTVACFKPEHGEFNPKNFKNTKDPVASVSRLLDEVMRLFSAL